jgi:hypothetical protein
MYYTICITNTTNYKSRIYYIEVSKLDAFNLYNSILVAVETFKQTQKLVNYTKIKQEFNDSKTKLYSKVGKITITDVNELATTILNKHSIAIAVDKLILTIK